jgi:XTP/dITP diphosphohydrolase
MKLIIASNNQRKIREIKSILGTYFSDMVSLKEAGINIDVVEDGDTFEANAVKKAEEVLRASGADAALSDDSGLVVDALDGAPGVYSARFSGEGATDDKNNAKLLELMQNIEKAGRTARFVSCVALARKGMPTITACGSCEGIILFEPIGDRGFGYDPLFFSLELHKSFGEAPDAEKNSVSHRYRALMALKAKLRGETPCV